MRDVAPVPHQREVSQERVGRARQRPSSSPPREILRERRSSSVQGRPLARQDLVNTSPRKGRGRDLSYHGAPLDSSLLLSARHLARHSEKPPRPRTSLSTAPPSQAAANPRLVRRPTTASEKKSAAARNTGTPAPPPVPLDKEENIPSLTSTKEPIALPAWTAQDLAGSEVTETSLQEDDVQEVSQPGRLQVCHSILLQNSSIFHHVSKVSLSGFPRQSIRLSADQSQGNFSILLRSQKHFPALPGAVEDSLQLDIETPEPAGIHRPLALTTTADNGLRIANN